MSLVDRIKGALSGATAERLYAIPSGHALLFSPRQEKPDDDHWEVTSPLAVHALNELASSGLATEHSGGFTLNWSDLYEALDDPDRSTSLSVLSLPPMGT